jgi:hypothetical protein
MKSFTNPLNCQEIFNLAKDKTIAPEKIKNSILEQYPDLVLVIQNNIVQGKIWSLEVVQKNKLDAIKHDDYDAAKENHGKALILLSEISTYFNEAYPNVFTVLSTDNITTRHQQDFIEFATTLDILFKK